MKSIKRVADSTNNSWIYILLPTFLLPYAQLARWDRPIGWQLLFLPCSWSLCLGALHLQTYHNFSFFLTLIEHLFFFLLGAILMRGAGCTYNDIIDAPIDSNVERTKLRPLPSKTLKPLHAWSFLFLQLTLSFLILLHFDGYTILVGLCSIPFIALYPFMKKISNWPQIFIGICFSWGILMGWSCVKKSIEIEAFVLYLGCFLWVVGYDTIYAHQDKEDDALLGIGSTALVFQEKTKVYLSFLYGGAFFFLLWAFFLAKVSFFSFFGLLIGGIHMAMQIYTLNIHDKDTCLTIFRSNAQCGFFIFFILLINILYKLFIKIV